MIRERLPRKVTLYIDEDTLEKMRHTASIVNMSLSQFIEHLYEEYEKNYDPEKKLEMLLLEREKLKNELKKIEEEINKIRIEIEEWEKLKENLKQPREKAIQIISRKILEGTNVDELMRIAKVWERLTYVPAGELIKEAKEKINQE